MANAAKLASEVPARILMVGYPGSGKTGALCALANAGYKLRILCFDKLANMQPLFRFTKPEFLPNIDIALFEDKLKSGSQYVALDGKPTAFEDALKMMMHWKYTEADGTEVDLGRSADWGPDTIVVLDSLTAMGNAAYRRAMALANRTPQNFRDSDYGMAMKEQEAFIEILTSSANKFHLVVLAHLKLVGPKDIRKGDDDLTASLKEKIADIVPTRYYPSALGSALPPLIGQHFSCQVLVKATTKGSRTQRIISVLPGEDIDAKVPALNMPPTLPQETGLLDVLLAVTGQKAPLSTKE